MRFANTHALLIAFFLNNNNFPAPCFLLISRLWSVLPQSEFLQPIAVYTVGLALDTAKQIPSHV